MRYDYQQDKIIKVSDASGRYNVEGGQYIPKSFITDDGTKVSLSIRVQLGVMVIMHCQKMLLVY